MQAYPNWRPYCLQIVQKLKENSNFSVIEFARAMIQKIDDSPPFFFNLVVISIRLGILKRRVYEQKATTIEELKAMIIKAVNEMLNDELKNAVENHNASSSLLHNNGGHLNTRYDFL